MAPRTPWHVYTLHLASEAPPFYVGITSQPERRLREHRALSCKSTSPFIATLACADDCTMQVHHVLPFNKTAIAAETTLCRYLHSTGITLANTGYRTQQEPSQ